MSEGANEERNGNAMYRKNGRCIRVRGTGPLRMAHGGSVLPKRRQGERMAEGLGDVVERVRTYVPVKERTILRCICVLLDE